MNNSPKRTAFDPPVRVTDTGREIQLRISLPGVTEEQIRIDLEKTTFTISVLDHDTVRKKTIRVPDGARIFRKAFLFGVLEIGLEKPDG